MSSLSHNTPALRACVIAFALVVLCACVPLAWAAGANWTVTFTGSAMTSDGSANIQQQVSGLQPGDSATFNVKLSNDCGDTANWYIRNSVLKSMEEQAAQGGSYTYRLTYTDPEGKTEVIFSNDSVSGEGDNSNGLFDATNATGDWFFLDALPAHGQGEVTLYVALDPESHGNSYFDTSAELGLSFAAEIPGKQMVTEGSKDPGSGTTGGFRLPSTGDMLKIGAVIVLVIAVIALWRIARKRASIKEEGGK